MPIIDHIDGEARRIYLSADTINTSIHPVDIYREMRTLRRLDESLRPFDVFMVAKGNEYKGNGKYTERYVILLGGTRIVPYNTDHQLTITGTLFTDDGFEGVDAFDRSGLTACISINYIPPQVEVIQVPSGLSDIEKQWLESLYQAHFFRRVWDGQSIKILDSNGHLLHQFDTNADLTEIIPK